MESNLTPEYIQFVNEGQNLNNLIQQVIDRIQYSPGFLNNLSTLLAEYEDPFEEVPIDPPEVQTEEQIKTSMTGTLLGRKLKPEYHK